MGRHDGVPDVLLDARTRRGGAGLWEIDGGADAASHPGHPADRCPHHAGIGVLAVPAPLRWGARRADADTVKATSFPRLRPELLEPILDDDQFVGRAGLQRPNHQEALVVRGHGVLRVKSEGCESRGRKEYRSAAERECRTGIYLYCQKVARGVAI